MNAWESIQSVLDGIEEDLSNPADIETMAKAAHLSPFYFQRLFRRLVGRPVMEYVKLRRLAAAADTLAGSQSRILDIAVMFGFESHETFTRAFRDAYGITPESHRKAPRPLSHFNKPDLSMMYQLVDEGVPLVAEGVMLEIRRERMPTARRYAGFSIQNPISDTPGVDRLGELWNRFHAMKGEVAAFLPEGRTLGLSSPGHEPGCFTYFAGGETGDVPCPEGLEPMEFPEGEYVVCTFEAENFMRLTTDALNKVRDYLFGTWLPHHKLNVEPFMAELYGDTLPDAVGMEIRLSASP